jgi:hypothetical protein
VPGTIAVVTGWASLAVDRERFAGAALVVAAITLPTGYAFILNVVLFVAALPLLVRPTPKPKNA